MISQAELKREINEFTQNPNTNILKEKIISQNKQLEILKSEFLEINQGGEEELGQFLWAKEQELNKKERELWLIVGELKNSGNSLGPTPNEINERILFENSLSPEELELRNKKVRGLKYLDKRCHEYEKLHENFKSKMDEKLNKILRNKKNFMKTEQNELMELLDNDRSNNYLIQEMEKMIKTMESSNGIKDSFFF